VRRGLALLAVLCACRGEPRPAPTPAPARTAGTGKSVLLITIDTLRADHLGLYGYKRATSPNLDAFARGAMVFDRAYTYWPKTRASFIMMMTGRRPSQNGYDHVHPVLLDFNATIASVLQRAGYETAAFVDNANLAGELGYSKGFATYRGMWEEATLKTEPARARAISDAGVALLRSRRDKPFFVWLHYVNPHAPYTPPPPFDTRFLDDVAAGGPSLRVTRDYHGGIHHDLAVSGHANLGYYVAQYDGEIGAVDEELGRVLSALRDSGRARDTLVVVASDHGESLGEHDYYFDHGQDLFEPCLRIPLVVAMPGAKPGRSDSLASTLDLLPTILDAVKVSYPPDLAGQSLLPAINGGKLSPRARLFAENDYHLRGTFDDRLKLVATPVTGDRDQWALYDRQADPAETQNVRQQRLDDFRIQRRELDLYFERMDAEWLVTRRMVEGKPGPPKMTRRQCEQLVALNYIKGPCE
jgi:arylsulfatase A-like enzyme